MSRRDALLLEVSGDVWHWRGPAPFYFVTVPDDECAQLQAVSRAVTYGWGMIPVRARIGGTEWTTSLFPKDGGYVVPVKDAVRRAEAIDEGDTVTVRLAVGS
jgi:FAD/FMN-containing dehydrogenase